MSGDLLKRGRFDQSFVVRMIVDFFLVLLLVALAELGLRFAVVVHDFYTVEEQATGIAAERLASDVRQIMMNTGGPVAARTVYPILERSLEAVGLDIAVEPSPVTVTSIEETFGFTPRGIVGEPREGIHHAVSVAIHAEDFCLSCHVEARPGDVLGTVRVRNYLSTHIGHWWQEVRLTGLMSLVKIMLHTTVLFFLLRIRMEPLLVLRASVAELTKGTRNLNLRVPVKSHDEFGELAADLNHFLDRISHIVEDLRTVLDKIAGLNHRMEALQAGMAEGLAGIERRLADAAATPELEGELRQFEKLVAEMALIEERMNHIAESGRTLVDRLASRPGSDRT